MFEFGAAMIFMGLLSAAIVGLIFFRNSEATKGNVAVAMAAPAVGIGSCWIAVFLSPDLIMLGRIMIGFGLLAAVLTIVATILEIYEQEHWPAYFIGIILHAAVTSFITLRIFFWS